MLTVSGTPDCTPFGELMISPIHNIYITESVSLGTHGLTDQWVVCMDECLTVSSRRGRMGRGGGGPEFGI